MNNELNALLRDVQYSFLWTAPEILLALGALLLLAIEALAGPPVRKRLEPVVALMTVGLAFVTNLLLHLQSAAIDVHHLAWGDMVAIDAQTGILRAVILATLFLGYCFALRRQVWNAVRSEYYALTMFSAVGAIVMVQATHLLILVMGLEILSLPLYTLAAMRKQDARSREAGLKYFVLGSLSSGLLIYGIALLYGGSGSAHYEQLYAANLHRGLYQAGAVLVLAGLLFKGGLMPFYVWSPDVYEGAPDAFVGLMAALAKVGAFGALIRLAAPFFSAVPGGLEATLAVVAALTMVLGNLLALAQTNLKRLLAYSSVAHAGYLLLGVLALGPRGDAGLAQSAIVFYLATYLLTIVAAFALVSLLRGKEGGWELADLEGAASRHPAFAFTLAVLMFSLAGIPPLAGFFGKAYTFHAAVGAGYTGLAVLGMLTSVVSVFYYLRVIVAMYLRPERAHLPLEDGGPAGRFATRAIVVYLLVLGLLPGIVYGPAWMAARHSGRPEVFPPRALPNDQVRQAQNAVFGPVLVERFPNP
ncbi:MAG TPA: NADH-quinone oxidoreductase subunit N [bacterium]|nr:NADH-quinone oxidoreductase subunit N [bacterium]